eukprot:Rhum_TRINITY_DN11288_c0_g1::Rhum_TRINITY_DN11288_c0_g1_i2::g.43700::m.43700
MHTHAHTHNPPPLHFQVKKAYYALARTYHPDNNTTGNQIFMNHINRAYAQLCGKEEMTHAREDTGQERPSQESDEYDRHGSRSSDERNARWRRRKADADERDAEEAEAERLRAIREERAAARNKERARRKRRYRPGGNASGAWTDSHGGVQERSVQRPDGTWLYRIRGRMYEADHYMLPIKLNYMLVRGEYSEATFEKLGLRPLGSEGEAGLAEAAVLTKEEREFMSRNLPLLFNQDGMTAATGLYEPTLFDHVWRRRYFLEGLAVAAVVFYLVSRVVEKARTSVAHGGRYSAVHDPNRGHTTAAREAREAREARAEREAKLGEVEAEELAQQIAERFASVRRDMDAVDLLSQTAQLGIAGELSATGSPPLG